MRALALVWVLFGAIISYVFGRFLGKGPTPEARERLLGDVMRRACERLGATFVKLGQILATRPDIVPVGVTISLARLQDDVATAPFSEVIAILASELGANRSRIVTIDPTPVAAASVAQVHRGVLDSGHEVAIKVQRRAAEMQIERDLILMRLFAVMLSWLPRMKYLSIPEAFDRFAAALRAQLDFVTEANNNRKLARNFASSERVRLPTLEDALCTKRVLVMEFVHGVKPTEVELDREELAKAGFSCIAQMVFLDGFVHADMHPGNLLLTRDGHLYLIDLGLVAEIPEELRRPWVLAFVAVATCNGREAARLFYEHAPTIGRTNYVAFEDDIVAHLDQFSGKPISELEVTEAVGGAMAILRRHEVQVDPSFTVVNLAMLVAEGVGKQLDPHFDVYGCVTPYLTEAAMRYVDGKAPLRTHPPRAVAS